MIMPVSVNLLYGMPQGLVLGQIYFCLRFPPLCKQYLPSTLMTHNSILLIKCKGPLESLTKLNICISDIRVLWMMNVDFESVIFFLISLLKQYLSDVCEEKQISQFLSVRNLCGVLTMVSPLRITLVAKSTHFHLHNIRMSRPFNF